MNIRFSTVDDLVAIRNLYRRVAAMPGGIARLADEVDESYVAGFLQKAIDSGIGLLALDDYGEVIAEIHACAPGPFCFSHLLSDLTIVVDPRAQGLGVGRQTFERFLSIVQIEYPHIERVELVARESNMKALKFYESLGFHREGRLRARIKNVDGSFEADIPMAWTRPTAGLPIFSVAGHGNRSVVCNV